MFKIIKNLPTPEEFKANIPVPADIQKIKTERDAQIKDIFTGKSDKFLLIIGPCSADDPNAVCEYVSKLAKIQDDVKDKILIIPRIYTNKPRTTGVGYKGMLHQPDPEAESDIQAGITAIRNMHIKAIRESHLTAADEMLYPENFMYIDDLISYHAIGARSVENQQHRLTASGIDAPVGMKNPTSGDLTVMFNSISAAQAEHIFLYRQVEVQTDGNPLAHAILRGAVNKHGESIPNYHFEDLIKVKQLYEKYDLANPAVIVDLNHSNSDKKFKEQPRIAKEIMNSRNYDKELKTLVKGLMIESYFEEGNQSVDGHIYGKSITDPCLGWNDSERLIYDLAEGL
ncbi:MAG: 3-deoxy-7-phosphoheptulonate synthase [Oscillospiraceae bacterium]|nr:3-deoxy-7-phosphoheptulonate synthase [Oscillospiraceae bacterium]